MKKILSFLLSCILIFPLGIMGFAVGGGNELFVSPTGNDNNEGTVSSPLATLSGAKEKAKNLSGDVTVYFRGGSYLFTDTVNFRSDDKSNVTFKAYNGEKVVFTSGVSYTGFEETTVNGVRAFKKNVGTDADFNVLYNETTTLPRTRYPESGYLYVANVETSYCSTYDQVSDDNKPYHCGYEQIDVKASDLKDFKNIGDAVVRILHFWKDEMLNIKSYDSSTGHMVFTKPTSMTVKENDRYFIENVFEALNEPGEWYLDKSEGVLYYIPKEGENAETLTLWGSETETFIDISGTDGITFENIIFRGNGFNIKSSRDFSQAAYDAPSCITVEDADGFKVQNCEFHDMAACSVFLGSIVTNAVVDSCIFDNIGAQAVYVRGENVDVESERVTKNITISNNKISKYGRVYYNAVAVLIIHANSVDVLNNEIHDGYYTAISVGWVWGYDYTVTYNNKICNNLIYNIGQGWLSDMGGIYTLGNQPGTVLSGNVIHNVAADPDEGGYGGWGIYLDEGSTFITVEKNLVYSCGSDAYHLHYGSSNVVKNNIFAPSGESVVRLCSAPQRVRQVANISQNAVLPSAEFTHNIYLTDNNVSVYSHWEDGAHKESDNIFWDISNGDDILINYYSATNHATNIKTAERRGYITNAYVIDPCFNNAKDFDFTFKDTKAVEETGFEPWDYSIAGTKKGTTIGIGTAGGETAYNAESEAVEYTEASEQFHFFMLFFEKVITFFKNLFKAN